MWNKQAKRKDYSLTYISKIWLFLNHVNLVFSLTMKEIIGYDLIVTGINQLITLFSLYETTSWFFCIAKFFIVKARISWISSKYSPLPKRFSNISSPRLQIELWMCYAAIFGTSSPARGRLHQLIYALAQLLRSFLLAQKFGARCKR